MSTKPRRLEIGGLTIDLVRKDIKNLHLGVYPPQGRVRVAAPLAMGDEAVRLAVISKLGWIKRQQAKFEEQVRQSEREYVSGESHYFLGRRYRLRVHKDSGPVRVAIIGKTSIELFVRPEMDAAQRGRVMLGWYRAQLKELLPPLLEKWESRLKVKAAEWGVKKMKTKWGSCNPATQRLWFNLELAKKPVPCIEYIVVHELAHLLERQHNDRFAALMDKHLPTWKTRRQELNAAPLGHDAWSY